VIAVVIVSTGTYVRYSRSTSLAEAAVEQEVRTVAVISPSAVPTDAPLLPARLEAWSEAPLNARVQGYVRSWSTDIGQSVTAGQTLAIIDTPDLDQELLQARAELARARGDARFAAATAERWTSLESRRIVSRQDAEQRIAESAARGSAADALQANVLRLEALQQFRNIRAPFSGVVVSRNTDVGALVGSAMSTPLFVLADISRLRVYVNVPQRLIASVQPGQKAKLEVPERPGETFDAVIASRSGAIDSQTGSMRVQLDVQNADSKLLAGSYATVTLGIPEQSALGIPPSSLIMGKKGVQVALVDDQNKVSLRSVAIMRDLGTMVVLADDLPTDTRVINSPPDGIRDGDHVRVAGEPSGSNGAAKR